MTAAGAIRREATALWQGGRGRSLIVVAVPWALILGLRASYPVMLPHFRTAYGLDLTTAGLLVSVLWFGIAVGQLPGGILTDRYQERTIMAASTFVVAVVLLVVLAAPSALVLFAATLVWGLGHSMYSIPRITILSDIYPDRTGSALGVTMATGDIGQTVMPPLFGVVALALAWELGLSAAIPLLLLCGIAIRSRLPTGAPKDRGIDTLSVAGVRFVARTLRRPTVAYTIAILFIYSFLWQTYTALFPTYLIEIKELSPSLAGALLGLFFAIGVAVKPVAGGIYDRIGMRWALMATLSWPVAGLAFLPFVDGLWPLAGATVLAGTMLGSGTVTQSYMVDIFPDHMRGSGLGVVRSIVFSIAATGPFLFGFIAELGYFDEGYLGLSGLVVILLVLTFFLSPD